MTHPLCRPVWNALVGRQADFAQEYNGIRRFLPDVAPFAATADGTPESLADLAELVPSGGQVILQQEEVIAPPPGLVSCAVSADGSDGG